MKTTGAAKTTSKLASQEQQENAKNSRKTLKILQEAANNKENLAGRSVVIKEVTKLAGDNDNHEIKRKKLTHKATQTGEATVTIEDLTSTEEPSADYWKLLAERREATLNDSLQENERLKGQIEALESENKICKQMIEESKHLIEVLQEMVGTDEAETSTEIAEEATECA